MTSIRPYVAGHVSRSRATRPIAEPATTPVFESQTGDTTWSDLVDDGYTLLSTLQGKMGGLVPDWSDADGNPQTGDRGQYGPDASRTPWRIASDYVWNAEPRAVSFLDAFGGVRG